MKVIATNKKGFFKYEVIDRLEAGIVLRGDEVKSIRAGHISLDEAYAILHDGALVLVNCYIAPYSHAFGEVGDPRRSRTLLLHKREISRLIGSIARKGFTIIPLKVYLSGRGLVKVELGVARHKSAPSKKRELRERDIKRQTEREIKGRLR